MYLLDDYVGPQAGTEGQLLHLIEHLDRCRYEPAMTVLRPSAYLDQHAFPCPVTNLGINKVASLRSMVKFLRYVLHLRQANYRIVHCFFNDVSMIAPPLCWLFRIPVLVSRRDLGFWYTPVKLAVLRLVAPFVHRYITNSLAVQREVQARERVPERKISVIYNGYLPASDLEQTGRAALAGWPQDARVIGIVANLRPIKCIDTIIEALALMSDRYPSACLIIVGGDSSSPCGGSMRGELERLVGQLHLRERVFFTGQVPDPRPLISRFDVAVLCSESEGLSNALIEYMQAGRPIVCTETGGNPELVQHGRSGFLVPVRDARALADRIVQLLADGRLARQVGETAQDTVRHKFSHTAMVAEHMACYDKVLTYSPASSQVNRYSGSL